MLRNILFTMGLMALPLAANAKDNVHYFDFDQVVQNAIKDGEIDGSVKFYLAGKKSGGKIIQKDVVSNKKTNGFNKSPEKACDWVLRSALVQFEKTAKAQGANAVTNIVSFYKKNEYKDANKFECHDGGFVTGVTIKGDLSKF